MLQSFRGLIGFERRQQKILRCRRQKLHSNEIDDDKREKTLFAVWNIKHTLSNDMNQRNSQNKQ